MSKTLRFSQHSPCDYIMYDGYMLFTLELKSFMGSCSFGRTKDDQGIVHYHQIQSLKKFAQYNNVCSGLILDFRKTDNTYFLDINEWDTLTNSITKKSFNESDMFQFCNPILIKKEKLKVNYRYDIQSFVYEIEKE